MADWTSPQPAAMAADIAGNRPRGVPYLVLAHQTDETAIAVASLLRQRHGEQAVELRSPEELLLALRWDHRISAGGVKTEIRMADGSFLAGNGASVIFNRIGLVDPPQFLTAASVDRDYARMEMFALLLSWLANAGCPVVNRPTPSALTGGVGRPPIWIRLAQIAGLPTIDLTATSSTRRFPVDRSATRRPDLAHAGAYDTGGCPRPNDFAWFSAPTDADRASFLTVGGSVAEDAPAALAEPCRRLAQLADTDILRLDFAASAAAPCGWLFTGANPCPQLSEQKSLARIVSLLETIAANGS